LEVLKKKINSPTTLFYNPLETPSLKFGMGGPLTMALFKASTILA